MSKTQDRAKAGMLAGLDAGHAQAAIDRKLSSEADRARAVGLLPLEAVHLRAADTRPARPEHVLALAESVGAVGLVQPLAVDKAGRLVAGLHRLEACRLLLATPETRPERWAQLPGADKVPDALDRLGALPDPEALPEPLRGGLVPVRRLVDLDALADPDAALAAEAAENTARRAYTRAEVSALVDRLRAAGYRESTGRPRRRDRALRPALELVLGVSRNTARRMLGTLPPGAGKVAQMGTFSQLGKAAASLGRAAEAYLDALDEALQSGQRAPSARELGRLARTAGPLAARAKEELDNLEGEAE
jgi:ParB family chromosome partitioning protein